VTAPDGTAWETHLPGVAYGLSRKTLDAVLADCARQCGVEVREAAQVTGLTGSLEEGFELETRSTRQSSRAWARTVVGASGKRSAMDRVLGSRFLRQRQPFVAIKAHFHGPRIPGRIELHALPGGYCGMSEIEEGGRVVCLLVHEETFQQRRGEGSGGLDEFVHWMMGQNVYLRSWLQWAERIHSRWITIAQVPFVPKPQLVNDVLMAGDAAGLIAPLAGNGIAMALEAGSMAACYLTRYLAGQIPADKLRKAYPAAWRKTFHTRLVLGRVLQPLLLRPAAIALSLKLFNHFPALGQLLVNHTRGIPPSSGAEGSSVYSKRRKPPL
jgi:flavin-dependent dehydrogenase